MLARIAAAAAILVVVGCASTASDGQFGGQYQQLLQGRLANSDAYLNTLVSKVRGAQPGADPDKLATIAIQQANPEDRKKLDESIERDFYEMLGRCEATFQRFEGRVETGRRAAFWTAIVGTIAGAIIVPALAAKTDAAKSTIAAWGGVAGVANNAQTTMKDVGIDAASNIATRAAIVQRFDSVVQEFLGAKTIEAKKSAVLKGYAACVAYQLSSAKEPTPLKTE
jgi:hypothetical protein